jgi:hypothetical protein
MDYNIDETGRFSLKPTKPVTENRPAQFIFFLKIWEILKKRKPEKLSGKPEKQSGKPEKPTSLPFFIQILNFK